MRVVTHQTKRGLAYYIIRDVTKANGKRSTETLEDLGTADDICRKYGCDDPAAWAAAHAAELEDAQPGRKILVPFDPKVQITPDSVQSYHIGYLFLQQIYYDLRLDLICKHIAARHAFAYDINDIMQKIIYGRILYPASKKSTYEQSSALLEAPLFQYHDVPRALSVIAEEFDTIQAELYEYSKKVIARKTAVLYYDCTNFFFEIEQSDDISNEEADRRNIAARKHGASKEHRPLPIVQMGLFMDYSGLPLAICLNRGNKNEQRTLIPLEQTIMQDFELSRFVVCTDAGLSSEGNRKFNNFGERSFITTVSIKKMEKSLQKWCLEPEGWHLEGSDEVFDISHLEDTPEDKEKNYNRTFYKQKYVEGYDEERDIEFNQTLIVTYSLKYRDYLKALRDAQVVRAQSAIDAGSSKIDKNSQNDYKRFINRTATVVKKKDTGKKSTDENVVTGEPDAKIIYTLNQEAIDREAKFDGFYAVETNLDDDVSEIIKVNKGRWEIEESFRIMKHDFIARPVYVSRDDRIKAHFLTCFIALLIYRILERKLGCGYTCDKIISTLRSMRMTKVGEAGYIPSYTRTELTDTLHETAGFRTDFEIVRNKAMRGIIRASKKRQN